MTDPHHDAPETPKADSRWMTAAGGLVATFVVVFSLVGFVILPIAQGAQIGLDPWEAICRAVGIQPGTPAMRQPPSTGQPNPVSRVAWTPGILDRLAAGSQRRGEQLAIEVCSSCHGEEGISLSPDYPHLSGQSAAAIYKQLHDYKSGARFDPQMSPVAEALSEQQLADIAAYFAAADASISLGQRYLAADPGIEKLVRVGDPSRGIPACNACHGAGVGGPIETPTLVGQHAAYLQRQLQLYATRERTNDVYGRMRDISVRLTPAEARGLAEYYQGTR